MPVTIQNCRMCVCRVYKDSLEEVVCSILYGRNGGKYMLGSPSSGEVDESFKKQFVTYIKGDFIPQECPLRKNLKYQYDRIR